MHGWCISRNLQMKYSPFWVILTLGIVVIPFFANADDDSPTIVVTSSRVAETADETMTPITVIDREEIDRSGSKSVVDILTKVPGLVVNNSGGRGAASSIFLRGSSSTNVLVLVDGIQIGSATSGTASLEHIPLSIVEKIEVVRGPRSSLYGSEAIGGVIQIFTRQGRKKLRSSFSVSAGSHDTYDLEAGVSGSHDTARYTLHVATEETNGFNFRKDNNPDEDGYQNQSLVLKSGVKISNHLDFSSGLTVSDNQFEYDGFVNTSDYETESLLRTLYVRTDWTLNDSIYGSLTLAESADKRDVFVNRKFSNRYNTRKKQISWQSVLDWTNHRIVSGIDFVQDQVESSTNYDIDRRDNIGYFALVRSDFNPVDVEASIRSDDNEQYGERTTGSLALGRDIRGGWRLTGAYGTAFQAPTFNQLYWPASCNSKLNPVQMNMICQGKEVIRNSNLVLVDETSTTQLYHPGGDPDLRPEKSATIDIGLTYRKPDFETFVNVYRTEIENMIDGWPPSNIDKALISGIEIGFQSSFENVNVSGSFTYQEPLNDSGINRNKLLRRRAKQLAYLDISQNFNPWEAGISFYYRGKSYDDPANKNQIDGFGRIDARLIRSFKKEWNLEFKINNVFDKDYETVRGYNQDGRNFLITLRYLPH